MIYDNIYALFGGLWGYEGSKHCRKEDGQWIHIEPSMLFVEATIDILCMVH